MFENIIVRSETGRGKNRTKDGIGSVIKRVGSHKCSSMNVSRQNKLNFRDPLFHCLRFGLRPFVVLFEVIGEVAIQIETSCVVPKKDENLTLKLEQKIIWHASLKLRKTTKSYLASKKLLKLNKTTKMAGNLQNMKKIRNSYRP